jgi:hypothetical protein
MNSIVGPAASVARTTFFATLVVSIAAWGGYALSAHVPMELLSALLKYSTGIIGIIWLFSVTVYNKLSDITDISGLDYKQHRHIEVEVRGRLQWFWFRALVLGLLALGVNLPSIALEVKLPISPRMIAAGFGALALSLFSLRRIWRELEEIRQLKSYIKELERREKERADQVKELKDGLKAEWEPDTALDGFRQPLDRNDK